MISVTGEATISVAPDLAQIEAGVTSDAKTAREATEANNIAMGKVLQALKSAGIDAKDIQTSRLSLQPQYAPNRTPGMVVGYHAGNHVTVRLHDVTKVAGTIDTLVGAVRPISAASISWCRRPPSCSTTRGTGGRRRPPQGRDLRQGRRRHARRAAQPLRGGRSRSGIPRQDGGRPDGDNASGARRGDAFGDRECVLGDQTGGAVIPTPWNALAGGFHDSNGPETEVSAGAA